ncbi:MAG: TonB-dependent receptor [Alphaproteobacteria bacterium]
MSNTDVIKNHKLSLLKSTMLLGAGLSVLSMASTAVAQDAPSDEVIVTGIRASLQNALNEKRDATTIKEVILAVDIGKLPDQNLAEVLENLPGIQITREAGVGTGVQIRGTNDNRTEINGVTTVGSGSGRGGISFEDVPAAMIAGVEVIKAPDAKTIEGAIGGTINLRTIRPLDLKETLLSLRVQGEESSLSTDGIQPRISGAAGKKWENAKGQEIGVVGSLSWTKADVSAFRPRSDSDNDVVADLYNAGTQGVLPLYIPPQFFIQDYDNYEYETFNFSGSVEARPSDNVKLYFDAVYNDQTRLEEGSRVQASGISAADLGTDIANIAEFDTINFGSLNGQDLGSIDRAARGIIEVQADGTDGNLRFSGDTSSRLTKSEIYRLGTDWERGNLSGKVEASISSADTVTPSFSTTFNFINPNIALDGAALLASDGNNENGTPFEYDLTGGSITFGVLQDPAFFGPSTAQLLDPANIVLRDVNDNRDESNNEEKAFRADFTYDFSDNNTVGNFLSSVDVGYRYNKTSSVQDQIRTSVGLRKYAESPTGDLFSSLLVAGPNNFGDADGRDLFVADFLVLDPNLIQSDPDAVLAALNAAIVANNAITGANRAPISSPTSNQSSFFDISEKTNSFYAQANFDMGIVSGNAGVRYVETELASTGNTVLNGVATPTTATSSYDYLLPRFNLIVEPTKDIVLRAAWGKDISRPDFDNLSSAITFSTSPNPSVSLGNPGLSPQEIDSWEVNGSWYFAPSAVVSAGYFHKSRTGLFVTKLEDVATTATPSNTGNVDVRDITDPCEGGGIFNPIADMNVFAPVDANGDQISGRGVCVPTEQQINGAGTNTQEGFEFAFQYDLSGFEDRFGSFGWASGFGVQANYTHQKFTGNGTDVYSAFARPRDIFAATAGATNVQLDVTEIDLSEDSYNATLYYEKYGLSARARYTWRSAYRSTDFGSTSSFPWGFPVVQEDRGQLNASINYDVNDHLNVGIEGVNLTKSDVNQSCINSGAVQCYQGLTDRRIVFGASYTF